MTRGHAYLFHNFTTTRDFSEIQRSIPLIMIICEILLFIFIYFYVWTLKSTMGGIGALIVTTKTCPGFTLLLTRFLVLFHHY